MRPSRGTPCRPASIACAAFLLAVALVPVAFAAPSFLAGTPIPLATSARCVAVGDVNGDGKPDVLCNHGDAGIDVALGNGNGTFGAPAFYGTPYLTPTSIALGRFDADTLDDLAFTSYGSRCVVVAMNDGSGGFGTPVTLPAGLDPNYIQVGDFMKTGHAGIAVTCYYSHTLEFYPGNGSGGFGTPVVTGTGIGPLAFGVADFDHDSRPDFAVACSDPGTVSEIAGGVSFPGFLYPRSDWATGGANLTSCDAGDLNNDGMPDVAATTPTGLRVFQNLGGGGLPIRSEVWPAGGGARAAHIADFDGDGKRDVVVANFSQSTVSVFPGNGDGTFGTRVDFEVGANPWAIAVADLDRDGDLDLVVAPVSGSYLTVLLNQQITAGVGGTDVGPTGLLPPRPNPATGSVDIGFALARAGQITAGVYDLQGRQVRGLAMARSFPAGPGALAWDGRDDGGARVSAGVYLVRLRLPDGSEQSRKLEYLR